MRLVASHCFFSGSNPRNDSYIHAIALNLGDYRMKIRIRAFAALVAVCATGLSLAAQATDYSLWINGIKNDGGKVGDYANWSYWGSSVTANKDAGVHAKSVNWDGKSHVKDQQIVVIRALDCFCTGKNWCYIAAHSAGNLMIGKVLATYGDDKRPIKDASTANDKGICGNADHKPDASTKTQNGWNIYWVNVGGGAAGGSELAGFVDVFGTGDINDDLQMNKARQMYDHNNTADTSFYMFAGAKQFAGKKGGSSKLLRGEDDGAIAYHSAGGVAGDGRHCVSQQGDICKKLSGTNAYSNAGGTDTVLEMGRTANKDGTKKWTNHSVQFRDDKEEYDHSLNNSWSGIMSKVRADMKANAK